MAVLVIAGPVLGLTAVDTGVYLGGIGWLVIPAFVVAWGAVSHRLIRRPGRPRWKTVAGAAGSVAWTCISLGMLFVVALASGDH